MLYTAMAKGTSAFSNMRTRLQRLKDAKFFSGWVASFDEQEARIRLSTGHVCETGDRFLVEIFGPETIATFEAAATMAFDEHAFLSVIQPIRYRRATEHARVCVTGMIGVINCDGNEYEARVADISRAGVGLIVRRPLPRKSGVMLKLVTPAGEISGEGEVRYCRPDPSGDGTFRAGVRLGELSRLEKARWLRLFESDAA
jgi:hypothetical protein